jgi:2,4-dienoyl-CoA reductase-like NADH-dependent reductase (Old Yellow Enzyme family)
LIEGNQPLSSSNIPITGNGLNGDAFADFPPRPMTIEEIKSVTEDWVVAAKNSVEAGFDGIEIHGYVSSPL